MHPLGMISLAGGQLWPPCPALELDLLSWKSTRVQTSGNLHGRALSTMQQQRGQGGGIPPKLLDSLGHKQEGPTPFGL